MKNTMNNKDSKAYALAAVLPRAASLLLLFLATPAAALGADPALPQLRVSDNGRFLVTADGKPFFWLGDTAWHMFGKSVRDDVANQPSARLYFANRAAKGFTVIQSVIVRAPEGGSMANAYGFEPFEDGDWSQPRLRPGANDDYWDHIDWCLTEAKRQGLRMAALPCWLDAITDDNPLVRDPDVAYRYGHFSGTRYGREPHLIWVLGGDAWQKGRNVKTPSRLALVRAMAEGIADGDGGVDRQDGQADWRNTLMTFHPPGGGHSSAEWLHAEPWLDFNIIQTTTRFAFQNWETVAKDYARQPPKPTFDAEVAYEGSLSLRKTEPQGLSWADVDGVKIPVPPPQHPRLYLRAEHVAQLPARLREPVLQPVVKRLETMASKSAQYRIEWEALQYLADPNTADGRATIARALVLLKRTELADRQDACRETGRMMVTGAIVYDWLYPLLTPEDKQAFIAELVRLAKTQECGYPPTRQGSVTGHSSEAMIMRDMISAGIAIYDEFPEMYRLAAGRFFREHLPARNWLYNGHAYHQGDSYGAHRYSWDTYPLWIFDRLGAGNVYNPEQRFVPYLWVYTTRPDGQRLRAGDTFMTSRQRGQPWSEFVGTLFSASYYGDGTLLTQFLRQGGAGDNEAIFEFLWCDPQLQAKPLEALPLSRYFGSPFGWMVARTGWDQKAVIAEMKVNEYNFVNHQHLDAGAFQVYYQGALAIDSGSYSGSSGKYGSPHCQNYYWRTIAHNSLLVYDPHEDFGRRGYGNDGGQRLAGGRSEVRTLDALLDPTKGYRTGRVLAHGFGPDPQTPEFTVLAGDLTDAYSKKVQDATRSFVFLNLHDEKVPAALIVFDRVVSTDSKFRKYWLLHTQEEPRIDGASAIVDCTQHDQRGRLTLDVLLPADSNRQLTSVGGPGKEYWVFGTNYANDIEPRQLERTSLEPGEWRIELSPRAASCDDSFLTVMQLTDRAAPGRLAVRLVELRDRVGSYIERPDGARLVLFRRDGQRSSRPVTIDVPGPGRTGVLVTDLAPGAWRARRANESSSHEIGVSQELGAAWFEASPGSWHLEVATP